MQADVLWLIGLGPLALAGVALLPSFPGRSAPALRGRLAQGAALLTLILAVVTAGAVGQNGVINTPGLALHGIGFGFYLDALSATMFVLVSFIGTIVLRYSRRYMDGDAGHETFIRQLCVTLAAVLLVIVSGNLFQFTLAWIATSMGLHRLLIFYPGRQAAVLAARKKFIASRLGDLCLIGAMVLLQGAFGSLAYGDIFAGTRSLTTESAPLAVQAAAVLLVVTGLLKSAQFPLHGWLIEVMETPTPVSALLHAGIINAGGFLVLRFADLMVLSTTSLHVLALVGGFTALFGSVVMLTQTSIKVSLAYSTIAQMGFMMLECGLGIFPAALLHIVAHSLYKAHAFLSSGSVIDIARASWTPSPGGKPHPARLVIAVGIVVMAALVVGSAFGATLAEKPGVVILGVVLMLGVIHLLANSLDERPNAYVVIRGVALAVVVAGVYFSMQLAAEALLAPALPPAPALRSPLDLLMGALIVISFAAVTVFQGLLAHQGAAPRWQALYVHVSNGFYVNTVANRLVLRFWPSPPPRYSASPFTHTR